MLLTDVITYKPPQVFLQVERRMVEQLLNRGWLKFGDLIIRIHGAMLPSNFDTPVKPKGVTPDLEDFEKKGMEEEAKRRNRFAQPPPEPKKNQKKFKPKVCPSCRALFTPRCGRQQICDKCVTIPGIRAKVKKELERRKQKKEEELI